MKFSEFALIVVIVGIVYATGFACGYGTGLKEDFRVESK